MRNSQKVVTSLVLLAGAQGALAQITYPANGHTYQLTSMASSWSVAEASAVALGGHLVSINDAAEQAFVQTNFTILAAAPRPLWIGLMRTGGPGNGLFANCSDGSAATYTNWNGGTGEPNNSTANGQPLGEWVAALNWHLAQTGGPVGTWNDTPDIGTLGFGGTSDGPYFGIIEIVPAPTSGALLALGMLSATRRRRA
ncbi:hypothetical protein BH11PLA1_BH11PLA1_12780 [soil metagenome]